METWTTEATLDIYDIIIYTAFIPQNIITVFIIQ